MSKILQNTLAILFFTGMITTVAVTQADPDKKYQSFASVLYK